MPRTFQTIGSTATKYPIVLRSTAAQRQKRVNRRHKQVVRHIMILSHPRPLDQRDYFIISSHTRADWHEHARNGPDDSVHLLNITKQLFNFPINVEPSFDSLREANNNTVCHDVVGLWDGLLASHWAYYCRGCRK